MLNLFQHLFINETLYFTAPAIVQVHNIKKPGQFTPADAWIHLKAVRNEKFLLLNILKAFCLDEFAIYLLSFKRDFS